MKRQENTEKPPKEKNALLKGNVLDWAAKVVLPCLYLIFSGVYTAVCATY